MFLRSQTIQIQAADSSATYANVYCKLLSLANWRNVITWCNAFSITKVGLYSETPQWTLLTKCIILFREAKRC